MFTGKDHKFFDKMLDNDLDDLTNFLRKKYEELSYGKYDKKMFSDEKQHWMESGSMSTVKWRDYNVFQFHHPALYKLFKSISEVVREACDYYGLDYDDQQYMVQGWFNINKKGSGKLGWHEHGPAGAPFFHGYYCVNAEPSVTHYRLFNNPLMDKDNVNKNNRMVISEMGHPHSQGDWDWDGDRITVAYDVMPLKHLIGAPEQHWIPLL